MIYGGQIGKNDKCGRKKREFINLGIDFQVVIQNVTADRQVPDVERVRAIPSLSTKLTAFADHSVEVAQRK